MNAPASAPTAVDFSATLPGGVTVFVPDSLENLTTFTLRERGDWFEDELRWLRDNFGAGLRAIDVGANVGCYALTLAARAGAAGRVWAFEPNPACADRLRRSAAANAFTWLDVREAAVADQPGQARFTSDAHTESGRLGAAGTETGAESWDVAVTTLDAEFAGRSSPIDLLKLDAEGAELRVLAGARELIRRDEPLVLCELRHGAEVNTALVAALRELGCEIFRLAPGPGVLVPLAPGDELDRFVLNVFAARPRRVTALVERGLLEPAALAAPPTAGGAGEAWSRAQPFAAGLLPGADWRGLDAWCAAMVAPERGHRAARLAFALEFWTAPACADDPWCLQSAARAAEALGLRERAVHLLRRAMAGFSARGVGAPTVPFLPASARFAAFSVPREKLTAWALAAVADALDRLERHCGWFQPPGLNELQRLVMQAGFADDALMRRVTLVRRRALARHAD